MKRYRIALFCGAFVLAGGILNVANAEGPNAAAQKHIDIAKAAAYRPGHDLTALYETVCRPAFSEKGPVEEAPAKDPAPGSTVLSSVKVPARSEWSFPPAKVFDNLYWLGSHADSLSTPQVFGNSTWAVKTSEGIILIDSGMNYSVKELVTESSVTLTAIAIGARSTFKTLTRRTLFCLKPIGMESRSAQILTS